MKKVLKLSLLTGSLFFGFYAFSQNEISNKSSYVLSFSTVYSSGLIDMNSSGYGDLYLLTSDKSFKIDSMMCLLSKKKYNSISEIFDTLESHFKIYTIVNKKCDKRNTDKVTSLLVNYNNYGIGYLFSLSDTIKKYSSVIGYIIQRNTLKNKIWYKILDNNFGNNLYPSTAVIIKME